MIKVEIGGQRTLPGWINLGLRDTGFNIVEQELPFDDNSVDQFYWSHVIEHIPACFIANVAKKFFNKLKPGGVVRTACPDLYASAVAYVNNEEGEFSGHNQWGTPPPEYIKLGIGGKFIANIVTAQIDTTTGENPLFSSDKTRQVGHFSHVMAYDFDMLKNLYLGAGFDRVERTGIMDIDPHKNPGQVFVNAFK